MAWLSLAVSWLIGGIASMVPACESSFPRSVRSCNTLDERRDTKEGHRFTGRHFLASYLGCDRKALRDRVGLIKAMERAVRASGATLLKTIDHEFEPSGITIVMLLSESHASVHTYPHCDACFVDLFTCGESCRAEAFDAVLRSYLKPAQTDCKVLLRHQHTEVDQFAVA